MKSKIFIISIVTLFVNSCTIEKRIYNDGFHVQWKEKNEHLLGKIKIEKDKKELQQISTVNNSQCTPTIISTSETLTQINFDNSAKNKVTTGSTIETNHLSTNIKNNIYIASSKSNKETRIPEKSRNGDNLILLALAGMSLAVFGLYRAKRKQLSKLTRWSKANPKKAQGLIAGLQIGLSGMALYSGYNLKQLDIELSSNANYLWLGLTTAGFLSSPFWAKKTSTLLPKSLAFNRIKYSVVILSSLMFLTNIGNTINDTHPSSILATSLQNVDQTLTASENNQADSINNDNQTKEKINSRIMMGGGICIAAVLLVLLLLIPLCAGVCLMGFGFSALGGTALGGSLLMIIGGAALAGLSVLGIITSIKWCRNNS